jgi:hypothetical protein
MDIEKDLEERKIFIEKIFAQSPLDTTYQKIEDLIAIYKYDSVKILSELWNINNTINNISYSEEEKKELEHKNKWDNIRDICDSHDLEMKKIFKHI